MESYSVILSLLKSYIEAAFRIIPKDDRVRMEFMTHLSVFDNVYLMGALAKIDMQVSQLNILKATEKQELSFNEIIQERDIVKPITTLFEWIKDISISIDNHSRAKYDASLMDSVGYMRTAKDYDITESVNDAYIDDIVTTIKKHTDIRIKLQSQLVSLLGGYMANMQAFIDGKENDYLQFYEIVAKKLSQIQYSEEEIKYIEYDAENLLYQELEGNEPIIQSFSKKPTADDWAELLKRKFIMNRNLPLYSVFEKVHNIKQYFELDNHYILDAVYYHCKDFNELQEFYDEFITLNYIKRQIMDTQNMNPEKLIQTNVEVNKGVVISGGSNHISIRIGKDGVEMDRQPVKMSALDYLDEEVRKRINEKLSPKQILLPVKGAKVASIPLPYSNEEGFNNRYNAEIKHNAWSRWINGAENCYYDEDELEAFVQTFNSYK